MGQMQNEIAIPTLIQVLGDESEHVMVSHEAATKRLEQSEITMLDLF